MAEHLRIAVLGASGTGKTTLATELRLASLPVELQVSDGTHWSQALCSHFDAARGDVSASTPGAFLTNDAAARHSQLFDLTLLTGLDVPVTPRACAKRSAADQAIRATLNQHGIAYTLVYGHGTARCHNAMLAIRFHMRNTEAPSRPAGHWRWSCEKCSDPDCEHRLFSALLTG